MQPLTDPQYLTIPWWKRTVILGAVITTFAGVASIVLSILIIGPLGPAEYLIDDLLTIAMIGTLGGLVGLHARQAPILRRLGLLAGFLAAPFILIFLSVSIVPRLLGPLGMIILVIVAMGALGRWIATLMSGFFGGVGGLISGTATSLTAEARMLPRWCRMAGIFGLPVGTLGLFLAYPTSHTGFDSTVGSYGGGMVLGLVWLALGYVLWSRSGVSAGLSPSQRRGGLPKVVVAASFVALALGGVGLYYLVTIPAPDLEGRTIGEAVQVAGTTDHEIEVFGVDASGQPKGTVIEQHRPEPNQRESRGRVSTIAVDLSGGRERVEVPNVSGMDGLQAAGTLIDAGLEPEHVIVHLDRSGNPEGLSGGAAKNMASKTVTATDPPTGRVVDSGTNIEIKTR